jgi:hypothetical protein
LDYFMGRDCLEYASFRASRYYASPLARQNRKLRWRRQKIKQRLLKRLENEGVKCEISIHDDVFCIRLIPPRFRKSLIKRK